MIVDKRSGVAGRSQAGDVGRCVAAVDDDCSSVSSCPPRLAWMIKQYGKETWVA